MRLVAPTTTPRLRAPAEVATRPEPRRPTLATNPVVRAVRAPEPAAARPTRESSGHAMAAARASEHRWAAHLLRSTGSRASTLAVTDARAVASSSVPRQSFDNSCGANALLAMEDAVSPPSATVDPTLREYAVMRAAGFQPEQIYRREGGAAGELGAEAAAGVESGRGLNYWGMRTAVADRFGAVASDDTRPVDAAITALEGGSPVALATGAHWVAAVDVRGEAGAEELLVRDSWTGQAQWVSAASLRDGSWADAFNGLPSGLAGPITAAVYPPPPPALSDASTQRAAQALIEGGAQS